MLRSQWDSRLKTRAKEEEAAAVSGRHLLRQPRLHLNNRVLKRLRDGRDLTYLSEQGETPPLEPEPGGAQVAGNGTTSSAHGPGKTPRPATVCLLLIPLCGSLKLKLKLTHYAMPSFTVEVWSHSNERYVILCFFFKCMFRFVLWILIVDNSILVPCVDAI